MFLYPLKLSNTPHFIPLKFVKNTLDYPTQIFETSHFTPSLDQKLKLEARGWIHMCTYSIGLFPTCALIGRWHRNYPAERD